MNSFDRDDFNAPLAEINTTPLVDVMLVLMVIFLITAPMLNNVVKLNLPKESANKISEQKPITLSIDPEGKYYWNDMKISKSDLKNHLALASKSDVQQIFIRADSAVPYSEVAHVLADLSKSGIKNIGFITNPSK